MPPRPWQVRIIDMLEAIDRIQEYTESMTWEEFRNDKRTIDAVIRNFEVLGEAANRVPTDIRVSNPDLPWDDMRDMRNFMIHQYHDVTVENVWVTIKHDLAPLVPQLEAILNSY